MFRYIILVFSALLLSGCLSTKEPVFDATNSLPLGDIPEFIDFADAWENFVSDDDSPREMIARGGRGIVVDGILVVQDKTEYFAVSVVAGRPLACVIHVDQNIEAVAVAHGVTVEVDRSGSAAESDDLSSLDPVPVWTEGPPEALMAFIRDQFANQALACSMQRRGGS